MAVTVTVSYCFLELLLDQRKLGSYKYVSCCAPKNAVWDVV